MPAVVFVTAFDQHPVRAFDAQAIDYVLKPIDPERFRRALQRARSHLAQPDDGLVRRVSEALKSHRTRPSTLSGAACNPLRQPDPVAGHQ